MRRRIYLIAQKNFVIGIPQIISDGISKIEVFAGNEGKIKAEKRVKIMNRDTRKLTVFVREGWLEF